MWINFVWGVLIAAFFATYMGKWIRRSRVITGAEWMVKRFGQGRPGTISIKGQGNLPVNKHDTAIFSWLICPVPVSFHLQS
jgi:hypothetical protein